MAHSRTDACRQLLVRDSSPFGFALVRFAQGFGYFSGEAEPALSLSKGSE